MHVRILLFVIAIMIEGIRGVPGLVTVQALFQIVLCKNSMAIYMI